MAPHKVIRAFSAYEFCGCYASPKPLQGAAIASNSSGKFASSNEASKGIIDDAEEFSAVYERDLQIKDAFYYFFKRNNMAECERRLQTSTPQDISTSFCIALVVFIRYIFSLKKKESEEALKKVEASCKLSENYSSKKKGVLFAIRALRRSKVRSGYFFTGEFRAKFVHATSLLLLGLLQLSTTSLAGMMRGVLTLRDGYKKLQELEEVLKAEEKGEGWDSSAANGVYLALGLMRTALSLLPPRMQSIASLLGLGGGDYDAGMSLLRRSCDSNTLFSPFASLAILYTRVQRCCCCPFVVKDELNDLLPVEGEVESEALSTSALHLWPLASIKRLRLKLDESIAISRKCLFLTENAKEWSSSFSAVRVSAMEDHALSLVIRGDWLEAHNTYVRLEEESVWSRIVYAYCQGCCLEMLYKERKKGGRVTDNNLLSMAADAYWRAAHRKNIVWGLRSKSVDALVIKRVSEILETAGVEHPNPTHMKRYEAVLPMPTHYSSIHNIVPLPGYELLLFFTACHQVPIPRARAIISDVDQTLSWTMHNAKDQLTAALSGLVKLEPCQHTLSQSCVKPPISKTLPDGIATVFLLTLKANLESFFTTCRERVATCRRIEDIRRILSSCSALGKEEPGTSCSLSYTVPLLYYTEAICCYYNSEIFKSHRLLTAMQKRYKGKEFYLSEELALGTSIALQRLEVMKKKELKES